jgi:hypothetical protein
MRSAAGDRRGPGDHLRDGRGGCRLPADAALSDGVGKPPTLVGAVSRGVDMFDCGRADPSGRTGRCLTRRRAQPAQRPPRRRSCPARPGMPVPSLAPASAARIYII